MTPASIYALARRAGLSVRAAVTATAVALAESGGDPKARGDVDLQDRTWGPSLGLWQIRSLKAQTGTGKDRDASRLTDPGFNAHSMYDISAGGTTFGAWSAYNSGAYREYLDEAQAAAGRGGAVAGGVAPLAAQPVDGWKAPDLPDNLPDLGDLGDAAGEVLGGGVLGAIGGAAGDELLDQVRPIVLTGLFVLGGLALVVAGAAAAVRPIKNDIEGAIL